MRHGAFRRVQLLARHVRQPAPRRLGARLLDRLGREVEPQEGAPREELGQADEDAPAAAPEVEIRRLGDYDTALGLDESQPRVRELVQATLDELSPQFGEKLGLARTHELLGDADAARRARRNGRISGVGPVEPS